MTDTSETPDQDGTSMNGVFDAERLDLAWILNNADDALRAQLRALASPPWPKSEPRETELGHFVAPILLGLLRDETSIDTLIALIPFADDRELDYLLEDCPRALATIGRPIIPRVIGRMLELERDGDLYNPDVHVDDDTTEYWILGIALALLASSDPGAHAEVAPFLIERLARIEPATERTVTASRMTVWIDIARHARIPEVDSVARTFLASLPEGYWSNEFGTAKDGLAEFAPDRAGEDLQARLERSYHDTIARFTRHHALNAEWSRFDRDEWFTHLLDGTGPFARDTFDAIETTPELLAMLRTTVAPPWEPSDDPEDDIVAGVPVSAAILLGLHGSAEDACLLLDALREAIVEDWDWMFDVVPHALAALGPDALGDITARIEALEGDSASSSSSQEMRLLIAAAGGVARAWPKAIEPFALFAAPRIADPANDDRAAGEIVELSIAESWVSAAFEIVDPHLESAILGFFDRIGEAGSHLDVGDRYDYLERPARSRPFNPRYWLELRYLDYDRQLREPEPPQAAEDDNVLSRADAKAFLEYVRRLESGDVPQPTMPVTRAAPKIGRNDPCPCGSGKKYKKCCGQ